MGYLALQFDADQASADAWSDALLEAGALSVDLVDPDAETSDETPIYAEPGEAETLWPMARLTALFAPGTDAADAAARTSSAMQQPLPPNTVFDVPDQDWVRATQAQFAPIRVAERLWIVPSWHAPVAGAVNLVLDPGLAFGTGSHPTTRLCLRWLATELHPGERVLDYGCGSGILAIAARLVGAADTVGVDIDPQAMIASVANDARNGGGSTFLLADAFAEQSGRSFDVVVANILATPLVVLAPALAARTRAGGRIVLSGILDTQADAVIAAYARWFRIAAWQREDGWTALAGERLDRAA